MTRPQVNHTGSGTSWCGPAAISVVTGRGTEEISQLIRAKRLLSGQPRLMKRKAVKGIMSYELDECLDVLGVQYEKLFFKAADRPTLAAFLDRKTGALAHRTAVDVYILNVTGHFLTVRGDRIIDNNHPTGVGVGFYPERRVRVKSVYEFDLPWRLGIEPCHAGPLPEAALLLLTRAGLVKDPSSRAPRAVVYGPALRGQLLDLLTQGATRPEIAEVTGWQPHTVRGWLSRLGQTHVLDATGDGAARLYRVLGKKELDNDADQSDPGSGENA